MASKETDDAEAKEGSVHTLNITEGDADPNLQFIREIANLKGEEETELGALYPTIDHMIEHLYSNPPSSHAQTELTFVYEGFRITLYQDGTAVFQEDPSGKES